MIAVLDASVALKWQFEDKFIANCNKFFPKIPFSLFEFHFMPPHIFEGTSNNNSKFVTPAPAFSGVNSSGSPVMSKAYGFLLSQE